GHGHQSGRHVRGHSFHAAVHGVDDLVESFHASTPERHGPVHVLTRTEERTVVLPPPFAFQHDTTYADVGRPGDPVQWRIGRPSITVLRWRPERDSERVAHDAACGQQLTVIRRVVSIPAFTDGVRGYAAVHRGG